MREISLHILDLAQNSIAADARNIEITIDADTAADTLIVAVSDDGKGIPAELLARVRDPFATTRTTRRVGLGIPMMEEAARACGGQLSIKSQRGKGTAIKATFRLSHVDRAPLGDIASTLVALVAANPDIRLRYVHRMDGKEFVLDTDQVRAQVSDVPINEGPVLKWLAEYVREATRNGCDVDARVWPGVTTPKHNTVDSSIGQEVQVR